MEEKILFVDDDPNILHAIKRQLRKRFPLEIATGPKEALQILKEKGPFAVIVSDMHMPVMNGIELLTKTKELYPDMVRLMLTGNADLETAMNAVNNGHIFRFLLKPYNQATFITSLALAQRQYRLITSEKELLQKTLKQSINVLSELLGVVHPLAFSSAGRIKKYVVHIAEQLHLPGLWQYEVAALMSQIGFITIPSEILKKHYRGLELTQEEQSMINACPEIASKMLEKIPRLEQVTQMIAMQQLRYDNYNDDIRENEFDEVIMGAQTLKAVIDFDILLFRQSDIAETIKLLRKRKGVYNPNILDILATAPVVQSERTISVRIKDMIPGMIPVDDVFAKNGTLIIPKGQAITPALLQGLKNYAAQSGIVEPIKVELEADAE
ncbi:HD domain-containing phosphohydrolase [Desulfogranum japonicum]|uniref:HD domain-containing phosphohydrolase n=1 Tax=Desulfogranum japonicum TaxID=231447 RepID=UPI00041F235E|nr:HD domain-containing phosphohydrolase [Desulfogranum japonicum]